MLLLARPLGADTQLTLRKKLRIFTDDRRVEGFTICIVLVYFLFIIMDFIVPELMFTAEGSKVTENWRTFTIAWQRIFWVIDFVFLAFFLLEIAVRVYAWGMTYVRDVLNMIDFSIVFVSFIMLFITLPYTMSGGTDSGLGTALALLRVFRIVRIFRLVVILNKSAPRPPLSGQPACQCFPLRTRRAHSARQPCRASSAEGGGKHCAEASTVQREALCRGKHCAEPAAPRRRQHRVLPARASGGC